MRKKLDIVFDLKSMGINVYIPVIVALILIGYSSLLKRPFLYLPGVLPCLEFIFPAFASWWSIFLLRDVIERPGSETLFTYPVSRWQFGIARIAIFFVFYITVMCLILFVLDSWTEESIFLPLAIQLGSQSFFFAGLGFCSMILTADLGRALFLVVSYLSVQILTNGSLLPFLNIFLFNRDIQPVPQLLPRITGILLLGSFLWFFSQSLLEKFNRYR